MKNIFKPLIALFFVAAVVSSCKKEESKIYFEGGTAPVLTGSTNAVRLEPGEEANTAIIFSWTNPDYKFTTGGSSHDVSYLLEYDTLGANFSSSIKQSISVAKELSFTYTVGALNSVLGNTMFLQLDPRRTYTMQARVTSSITGGNGKLTSNIFTFTVKPFPPPPKVALPASGKLFITGSATPGGWMPAPSAELLSQKLTQMSSTKYVMPSLALTGGGSYKFVPIYGDWSVNYGFTGASNANNVNGDNFSQGGNDVRAPAVSGNYKIEVDFQLGKFTVTKL